MCSLCQAPQRVIWEFANYPTLDGIHVGNWNVLKRCPQCNQLWVEVPHEPFASFTFPTAWPSDAETWQRLNDTDQALIIHEGHDAVIRENWQQFPNSEKADVERWRDRTYRHYNPVDRGPEIGKPRFIETTADLRRFIA